MNLERENEMEFFPIRYNFIGKNSFFLSPRTKFINESTLKFGHRNIKT